MKAYFKAAALSFSLAITGCHQPERPDTYNSRVNADLWGSDYAGTEISSELVMDGKTMGYKKGAAFINSFTGESHLIECEELIPRLFAEAHNTDPRLMKQLIQANRELHCPSFQI